MTLYARTISPLSGSNGAEGISEATTDGSDQVRPPSVDRVDMISQGTRGTMSGRNGERLATRTRLSNVPSGRTVMRAGSVSVNGGGTKMGSGVDHVLPPSSVFENSS